MRARLDAVLPMYASPCLTASRRCSIGMETHRTLYTHSSMLRALTTEAHGSLLNGMRSMTTKYSAEMHEFHVIDHDVVHTNCCHLLYLP